MSKKKFNCDYLSSSALSIRRLIERYITPKDELRLEKTLGLIGASDIRPSINGIMSKIVKRLEEESRIAEMEELQRRSKMYGWPSSMIYDCMGEDDYLYDDEESCLSAKEIKKLNKKLFTGKNKEPKSNKRGSRGKGKNKGNTKYITYDDYEDDYWKNRHSMYHNGEWEDYDNEDRVDEYKSIKFYSDITNELSVREFHSLKSFSDYCDDEGITVPALDYSHLKDWGVIHCCLDPIDLEYGHEKTLITDTSYGGLYWTVEPDLPSDVKSESVVTSQDNN